MTTRTKPQSQSGSRKESAMTETVVVNDTEKTENTSPNGEAETPKVYSSGGIPEDYYLNTMRPAVIADVNSHNAKVQQAKDAGDRVAITDSLKDNPDQTNSPEFITLAKRRKELSDALEEAEKEFAAKAEPFIQEHLKRSGVEKLLSDADELAKKVRATTSYMDAMGASTEDIPTLTSRSGKSTTGDGRGAGVTKYRNLDVYVDGKLRANKVSVPQKDGTKKQEMRSNLTLGAAAAGVSGEVFREAFTNAQGTKDAAQFKDSVEFSIKGDDGKDHAVLVRKHVE